MALRLAITHNLHKRHNMKRLCRSESVHRNRLWWSVYMQERFVVRPQAKSYNYILPPLVLPVTDA